MGIIELFAAVVIVGVSCINAAPPAAAWFRSGDGRFGLLCAANATLAVLGGVWAWGQLPYDAPSWTAVQLPVLLLVLVVTGLLLATTIWPRRT